MEVADARPYRFWRTSQELIEFCKDLPVSQTFVRNVAEQSPTGIVIERSFGGVTFGEEDPHWPLFYLPELVRQGRQDEGQSEVLAFPGT